VTSWCVSDVPTMPPAVEPPRAEVPPAPRTGGNRRWIVPAVAGALVFAGVIVGLVLRGGGDGHAVAASPTAGLTPAQVIAAPVHLQAHPTAFKVVLTWRLGTGGAPAASFQVTRDGTYVGSVGTDGSRFVDDSVLPTVTYRYEVEGVASEARSNPASVRVKTLKAPLGVARLQGVFNVRFVKTSSYGVNGIPDKTTEGWRFTPKCDAGACSTEWNDIHWKALGATLKRTGASYSATTTVHGFLQCSGTPSTSSYTVKLHVTKAATVKDAWRVTGFEGTVTTYDSAQLGCRSSSITYSINGALAH
jgi:hypothetical protein